MLQSHAYRHGSLSPRRTGLAGFPHPALLRRLTSGMHRGLPGTLVPVAPCSASRPASRLGTGGSTIACLRSSRPRVNGFRRGACAQAVLYASLEAVPQWGPFAPPPLRGFLATMSPSDSRPEPPAGYVFPTGSWASATPRRVSQVRRLICRNAPPPFTPEGPTGARTHDFPVGAGFITSGRLATLT